MSTKASSLFLATLMMLSVILMTPAQAGGGDDSTEDFENIELTLTSADGVEILSESQNPILVQGATVELKWQFENLENDTNYTFNWQGWDVHGKWYDMDGLPLIFEESENFTLADSTNHTLSWTLIIPDDSCFIAMNFELYLQDTGQIIDYDPHDANLEEGFLICDWAFELDEDKVTAESSLKLDAEGLVLTIRESSGPEMLSFIDYFAGNRDGVLNQSEFDGIDGEDFGSEDGSGYEECITREAELGTTWLMNGEEIEYEYSHCESTFDETGIHVSAHILLNGSWEADENGEWILEVFSGDFYDNCTMDSTFTSSDGSEGRWDCVSDILTIHYYGDWDTDGNCVENTDNGTWSCPGWDSEDNLHDNCTPHYWTEYDGGPTYTDYSCTNEGEYSNVHYDTAECELNSDNYYCDDIENTYWWMHDSCEWQNLDNMWLCEMNGRDTWDYCEWDDIKEKWFCTWDFGKDAAYANTTGNSHHSDNTIPPEYIEEAVQTVRYGITSSDSFDLISSGFFRDDGDMIMMAVTLGSTYADIPYDWDAIDHGTFVWKAVSDGTNNNTDNNTNNNTGNNTDNNTNNNTGNSTDDTNNTSEENNLPVCAVFAISKVGASGPITASDISTKIQSSTALDAPLDGTVTVPLLAGEYEFMVDCTDPDADGLVISISDGIITVTAEAIAGHFYGGIGFIVAEESSSTENLIITWTDGTESGELKVIFTTIEETVTTGDPNESSGLPGFTTPLSLISLLGAAMLFGRSRKDE